MGDSISRTSVLNMFSAWYERASGGEKKNVEAAMYEVEYMPDAEPVEWYNLSGNQKGISKMDKVRCPVCGYITSPTFMEWEEGGIKYGRVLLPKKCNGCGTMMVGESE